MASSESLVVEAVHMYEKNNAKNHHTCAYEAVHLDPPTPVLRRGQGFHVMLRFNREYVHETDIVRLIFSFGDNSSVLRGTRAINTVTSRESYSSDLASWGVRMVGARDNDLSVEVRSPVDSPVGVWSLNVETTTLGRKCQPNIYEYDRHIYLLFNPWVKGNIFVKELHTSSGQKS